VVGRLHGKAFGAGSAHGNPLARAGCTHRFPQILPYSYAHSQRLTIAFIVLRRVKKV
jgi:hypothetical protein